MLTINNEAIPERYRVEQGPPKMQKAKICYFKLYTDYSYNRSGSHAHHVACSRKSLKPPKDHSK